jgi:membrane-associated phospholipid phosphatase
MPRKPFSPRYLAREANRFLYHFYRSYKDYLLFFAGIFIGVLVVALLGRGFYELLNDLRADRLGAFDDKITLWVLSWQTPALDSYMASITHFGDRYAYIMLSVILGLYLYIRKGNLIFTLQAMAVLIVAGALSFWLKDLIGRPRPEAAHQLGIHSLSFPSGHSMSSIAFYGFLIHLTWRIYKSRLKKIVFTIILVLLILSIGISRIYLQVHYPSDVLSGFAAGGICLIIFILLFSFLRFRQRWKGEDRQPDTATAEENGSLPD